MPSVASAVMRAMLFRPVSSSRGHSIITAAPTSGRNTPRVSTQWSNPFIQLLCEGHKRRAKHDEGFEEEGSVLLDAPGLEHAEAGTGLLRHEPGAVHRAVDDLLVDDVIGEAAHVPSADAEGIDDGIDDVLVDPVSGARHRALDATDDPVGVEVVEVVLPDQQRLAGASNLVALAQAVQGAEQVTFVVEE